MLRACGSLWLPYILEVGNEHWHHLNRATLSKCSSGIWAVRNCLTKVIGENTRKELALLAASPQTPALAKHLGDVALQGKDPQSERALRMLATRSQDLFLETEMLSGKHSPTGTQSAHFTFSLLRREDNGSLEVEDAQDYSEGSVVKEGAGRRVRIEAKHRREGIYSKASGSDQVPPSLPSGEDTSLHTPGSNPGSQP